MSILDFWIPIIPIKVQWAESLLQSATCDPVWITESTYRYIKNLKGNKYSNLCAGLDFCVMVVQEVSIGFKEYILWTLLVFVDLGAVCLTL